MQLLELILIERLQGMFVHLIHVTTHNEIVTNAKKVNFIILKRFTDTLCIKHPNASMKCAKILYYFTSTSF